MSVCGLEARQLLTHVRGMSIELGRLRGSQSELLMLCASSNFSKISMGFSVDSLSRVGLIAESVGRFCSSSLSVNRGVAKLWSAYMSFSTCLEVYSVDYLRDELRGPAVYPES